jgi:hypothetical protein
MKKTKGKKPRLVVSKRDERDTVFEVIVRFEFIAPLTAEEAANSLTAACNAMAETAFLDDRIAAAGLRLEEGCLMKERPMRPTLKVVPK